MGLIYLDSVFCIYSVEDLGPKGEKARNVVRSQDFEFVISPLVQMECLVIPYRLGRFDLEQQYKRWFSTLKVLSISPEVYDQAARLRAVHPSLRTADALHLATTQFGECSQMWTGDAGFAKVGTPFVVNVFAS